MTDFNSKSRKIYMETTNVTSNDINLTQIFAKQLSALYMKPDYADVVFIIGEERVPAHRIILGARSEYFSALLCGGLNETQRLEVHLDVPIERFKVLLQYIYSGHIVVPPTMDNESDLINLLILAKQYGFEELIGILSQQLRKHFLLTNVSTILDAANIYRLNELVENCLNYMDDNAFELLKHPTFMSFRKDMLELVLKRDTFVAPEISIFVAVRQWHEQHADVDVENVVACLRLELLTVDQLMEFVRPSDLVTPKALLAAIEKQRYPDNLPFRIWPERNVATTQLKTAIYLGNGDTAVIDLNENVLCHNINEEHNQGIVLRLGHAYVVNHLKLHLCDVDKRVYGYIIQVSTDKRRWENIVNYGKAHASSWQYLYFPKRLVQYVRLIGISTNHIDRRFIILGLELVCTLNDVPNMAGDVVIPKSNVALTSLGATAMNKSHFVQNDVLDPSISYDGHYDFSVGRFTGSGYLLVRLGQPYHIGSLRLLFWDQDDRTYRYIIEISLDKESWQVISDKRHEDASGWQTLNFTPRAVIYIRVICTSMSAIDGVFRCVHFECPFKQPSEAQNGKQEDTKSPIEHVMAE